MQTRIIKASLVTKTVASLTGTVNVCSVQLALYRFLIIVNTSQSCPPNSSRAIQSCLVTKYVASPTTGSVNTCSVPQVHYGFLTKLLITCLPNITRKLIAVVNDTITHINLILSTIGLWWPAHLTGCARVTYMCSTDHPT